MQPFPPRAPQPTDVCPESDRLGPDGLPRGSGRTLRTLLGTRGPFSALQPLPPWGEAQRLAMFSMATRAGQKPHPLHPTPPRRVATGVLRHCGAPEVTATVARQPGSCGCRGLLWTLTPGLRWVATGEQSPRGMNW